MRHEFSKPTKTAVHAAMIRAWRSGRAVAAEPVAVKPLEWRGSWGTHSADTELGTYEIKPRYDGAADWFAPDQRKHWASSATEAKAAAQADYEARIRSALASPTVSDEMVERERQFARAFDAISPYLRPFVRLSEVRAALLAALGGHHD